MFTNLLVYSYYSISKSILSIDDIVNNAKKNNYMHVSLVDFNVLYGAIEFYNKAIENNLKPIIGLEIIYENNNINLIALNYDGYKNLVKISSFIMQKKKIIINKYLNNICIIYQGSKPSWISENMFSFE
jgi:DNA polymerase-3 subunit alpha